MIFRAERDAGHRCQPTIGFAASIYITIAFVLFLAFLMALVVWAATPARAHDWYPAVCCNGNAQHGDCQPIGTKTVRAVAGGWQITLVPGDHWMVTKPHNFFVSSARAKQSPDGDFHICLYPSEDNVQCFFAPPMGV